MIAEAADAHGAELLDEHLSTWANALQRAVEGGLVL
jgi:hypothetical protein